eukprot:Gb_16115 [translate_table: standard]
MPPTSIAHIRVESFLKGLLATHRGGYLDSSQKEERPAPLLWRSSDFMKWDELCPSEQDLGHALMRLVISGHDMPHACEVELLILAHHFYKSSTCLDGVDVLVALEAIRVECCKRGFFMFSSFGDRGATIESTEVIRGFQRIVLSTLKHFNLDELDAFAMLYNHFDMKHEMSTLLESRVHRALDQWLLQHDRE